MAMATGPVYLTADEQLVQCPYERSHMITNARLLIHLDKCRRNYIRRKEEIGYEIEYKACRWNNLHRLPAVEMAVHEKKCPDQSKVIDHISFHASQEFDRFLKKRKELDYIAENPEVDPEEKTLKYFPNKRVKKDPDPEPESEEDWEEECKDQSGPGYDPTEKLKTISMYHPMNMSKSERKKFRSMKQELAKMVDPQSDECTNSSSSSNDDH